METYAVQIVDDVAVEVIVGDPVWATDALGGVWVGSESLVGIGWRYVDGVWIAPPPPEPEPELEPDPDVPNP